MCFIQFIATAMYDEQLLLYIWNAFLNPYDGGAIVSVPVSWRRCEVYAEDMCVEVCRVCHYFSLISTVRRFS